MIGCLLVALAVGASPAPAQDSPARAGDRILLRIVRDTALADTLQIGANGAAFVPLVGDVTLAGIAGGAVQDTLRARLSKYVAPTAVEAILLRRVRVIGDVMRAGVLYADRTMTIRDVMAVAGGSAEFGQARRARLDRGDRHFDLADWRTDAAGLWPVESGDQIVVERLPWYERNIAALVGTATSLVVALIIAYSR